MSADEAAVVDELAQLIRKQGDQNPASLARPAHVAFGPVVGAKPAPQTTLAMAELRELKMRRRLTEADGGRLSLEEVARLPYRRGLVARSPSRVGVTRSPRMKVPP